MEERLREVEKLIRKFKKTNNLFDLANAWILIQEMLDIEEFPKEKYKQWLK